jgi:hypothetical protein
MRTGVAVFVISVFLAVKVGESRSFFRSILTHSFPHAAWRSTLMPAETYTLQQITPPGCYFELCYEGQD